MVLALGCRKHLLYVPCSRESQGTWRDQPPNPDMCLSISQCLKLNRDLEECTSKAWWKYLCFTHRHLLSRCFGNLQLPRKHYSPSLFLPNGHVHVSRSGFPFSCLKTSEITYPRCWYPYLGNDISPAVPVSRDSSVYYEPHLALSG